MEQKYEAVLGAACWSYWLLRTVGEFIRMCTRKMGKVRARVFDGTREQT